MHARNTATSWGWVARGLHWAVAALVIFQLGLGVSMVRLVSDPLRQFPLYQTHKSWGFVIFALVSARLGWRLLNRAPADPPAMPRWQRRAAHATHGLLYALLLALPLSGWVSASASPTQDLFGIPNMVFDWFALPDPWVPGDARLADLAAWAHTAAAVALVLLLAPHVGGAVSHRRDGVLARMTFGR
ncbi:cytochrome b [Amaricoccus solimangrovi]|uniref:cytochrome b n=1 Tax=Amaricoccus solimangrovi TaxID=2589815 RepID=UPI0015E29DB3|nr:cytochrome b [Amaricoccus solimangrovi]